MNEDRKYVALSIKHTSFRWRYGKPCILWGYHQTKDDEPRCFADYTIYLDKAERYSIEDFINKGYTEDTVKREPVQMCQDLCKKYKKYDTVLVEYKDYKKYCETFLIATSRSEVSDE